MTTISITPQLPRLNATDIQYNADVRTRLIRPRPLLQPIHIIVEFLRDLVALLNAAFLELGVVALEEFFLGGADGLDEGWAADAEDDAAVIMLGLVSDLGSEL